MHPAYLPLQIRRSFFLKFNIILHMGKLFHVKCSAFSASFFPNGRGAAISFTSSKLGMGYARQVDRLFVEWNRPAKAITY